MKKTAKERFFIELENQLVKYFSIQEVIEIRDDYKIFFDEKELDELSVEDIIKELGEPHLIVQELIKDKTYSINIFQKLMLKRKAKGLFLGIWVVSIVVFLSIIQWSYMTPATGIGLSLMQIGLFLYIFEYRKILLNKVEIKKSKNIWLLYLFTLITSGITYYNMILLRMFSYDQTKTPILNKMSASEIGPFVHYQILIALFVCFILLYVVLLKWENLLVLLSSLAFYISSIIVLILLHAQLGNLSSMSDVNHYINNQLKVYTIIIMVYVIFQVLILRVRKREEK